MSEIIEQGGGEVADTGPAAPILSASSDLEFAPPGPALFGIADALTLLEFGSDGTVHLLLAADDNALGGAVNLAAFAVQVALLPAGPPGPGDWRPGAWLNRTAAPAGTYATLAIGPDNGLVLPPGQYWMFVRITAAGQAYVLRSGNPFLIRP